MPRERIPLGTWSTVKAHPYTPNGTKKNGSKKWRRLTPEEQKDLKQFSEIRWRASVYYRGKNGHRQRAEAWAPSRAAAIRAVNKKLPDRVDTTLNIREQKTTVEHMAMKWWTFYEKEDSARKQTKDTYKDALDRHVLPHFGGYTIQEVTTGLLTDKLRQIGEGAPSNAWFARVVLKHIFTFAVRRDAIENNPVEGTPTFKTKSEAPVAATLEQLQQVRKVIMDWQAGQTYGPARGEKLLDVLDLMLVVACRTGEALAVRAQDLQQVAPERIPFAPRYTIALSGTIISPRDGGTPYRQAHPKTKAGFRTPYIPAEMAHRLFARIKNNPANDEGLIFPTRDGRPMSPNNFRSALRRALKGSEFEGALKPYLMRKTAATEVAHEMSIEEARVLLGHTDRRTTEKFYAEHDVSVPDTSAVLGDLLKRARS